MRSKNEILENFEGELLDVPYDTDNEKRGIEEIGEMSENAKKLYTLLRRKLNEKGELIKHIVGTNPYESQSEYKQKIAFNLFDRVATLGQRRQMNRLEAELKHLSKILESQNYYDFPKSKNCKLVFKPGWKLWQNGQKKKVFYLYWESGEF
jgi:hypothetical protein